MYIPAFILTMATPLSMFIVGLIWRIKMPTKTNFLSYRSELAMKSDAAWEFAHKHICKLWMRVGVILTIITVILMRVFAANYANFVLWLLMGQMVFFCGTVFFVDSIMKAVFDENGVQIIE